MFSDGSDVVDIDFRVKMVVGLRHGNDGLLQGLVLQHVVEVQVQGLLRNLETRQDGSGEVKDDVVLLERLRGGRG
jgi:hypothetical protein